MTLTQKDLNEIEKLFEEKFEEKFKYLPTKEEFFNSMDQIMGELKAIREKHAVQADSLSHLEDRTDSLEKIHP